MMMMMMRARPWIRHLRWAGMLAAATTIMMTHIHALVVPVSPPLPRQQQPPADRHGRSTASRTTFPANLVRTLDLSLVLTRVADHCGTRRGRIGLLRHADPTAGRSNSAGEGRRRRRLWTTNVDVNDDDDDNSVSTIARSPEEAIELWRYVEAAAQSIQHHQDWPPLYPKEGPLDTSALPTVVTDDDEWLQYGSVDEFTLQDIWQAEQVIARLIEVHTWMEAHPIFRAVRTMDVVALEQAREAIWGTVSITKLRSVTGTAASYTFALNQATKFPVLALLQRRGVPEEELEAKKTEIRHGLALRLLSVFAAIDNALNTAAWLDVIFAKAAFGLCRTTGGSSTVVGPHCRRHDDDDENGDNTDSSKFEVRAFQHPLLLDGVAVPTDLLLGGEQHCSSLVISGPNGGGKSLTLKSFGLLAVLYKVAIPLAVPDGQHNPSIPFYHTISVSLGDAQNIQDGESTFTAKLNEYSRTLSLLREDSSALSLILLDELGAGTDESSGGCIGQAIIEELAQLRCHVVATTHSSRLKTFAYSSDSVAAASVVLDGETGKPAYRLAYNTVGQANALSALRRSNPPFPESFLIKTQGLMAESNDDSASRYITALTESLSSLNDEAETENRAARIIRKAIAQLAASYADHLTKLEYKLDRDYLELLRKKEVGELDSIAVIGNSLSEVRLVRQAIETESDLLRKQGLKKVSVSYEFRIGETAVVVDELSPWHGQSVKIVATETDDMVRVAAVDGLVAAFEPTYSQLVGRYQLAVWDYDSVWNDDDDDDYSSAVLPAVPLARRRLNTVLASINAAAGAKDRPPTTQRTGRADATNNGVAQKASRFQSSRERKSAKLQKPRK